jgi:hypothetical protein
VFARLGRGARRIGLPLVIVVAALLALVLSRHRSTPPDFGATQVVRVGVSQGASIPGYLADSRSRLATLAAGGAGTAVDALVSFDDYLSPDAVAQALTGVQTFQVYERVPLPHTQTAIVKIAVTRLPGDLLAGMEAEAGRRAEDARRTGDPVAAAEADRYRAHCSCGYAAVVRADAATLAALATRPTVRAVDPAPAVTDLSRAVFLPPLPEQSGTAQPPDDSGASAAGPAAGGSPSGWPSRR